jgi:anti-anti-sigma regulatory factor
VVPAPRSPGCVARLSEGVARIVAAGVDVVVCDVADVVRPDLLAVDAVARMQLAARRHGGTIRLLAAAPALTALVELAGLAEVVRPWADDDGIDPGPPHLPWEVEAGIDLER